MWRVMINRETWWTVRTQEEANEKAKRARIAMDCDVRVEKVYEGVRDGNLSSRKVRLVRERT